jgi:hypothetical protein
MAHDLQANVDRRTNRQHGWQLPIKLEENLGYDKLKTEFQMALENEEEHLHNVRTWLSDCVLDGAEA